MTRSIVALAAIGLLGATLLTGRADASFGHKRGGDPAAKHGCKLFAGLKLGCHKVPPPPKPCPPPVCPPPVCPIPTCPHIHAGPHIHGGTPVAQLGHDAPMYAAPVPSPQGVPGPTPQAVPPPGAPTKAAPQG